MSNKHSLFSTPIAIRFQKHKKGERMEKARKEDLELPIKSTSSPDADFTRLATRTPVRSAKGIQVLGKRSKGKEWGTKVVEGVAEESEKEEKEITMSEEKLSIHKKEEILACARMLLWTQLDKGRNGKLGPHHHPFGDK
ncbi:hypothetical protein Csa_011070 [Cucumis sativus]|uniref:Uncharacterized protein n=1 Tax=Cucumis sativus TaxID=3659 RepID=A0A0A0L7Q4_CUCSA|nr:hypothetical protein Csa_011070 [Cucumis sativus]